MSHRLPRRLTALLACSALILAGCSDDDDDGTADQTTTTTPAVATTGEGGGPSTSASTSTPAPRSRTHGARMKTACTGVVALSAFQKFVKVGAICHTVSDGDTQLMLSALMNDKCVCVLVSHSGDTVSMVQAAKLARSYGIEKYSKIRKHYTEVPLLILDEWLMFKIDEEECKDLLQIIDRRSTRRSTIVISQYSPDEWIGQMPIQVAAEAITDRVTAQAYTITIESRESMRQVVD